MHTNIRDFKFIAKVLFPADLDIDIGELNFFKTNQSFNIENCKQLTLLSSLYNLLNYMIIIYIFIILIIIYIIIIYKNNDMHSASMRAQKSTVLLHFDIKKYGQEIRQILNPQVVFHTSSSLVSYGVYFLFLWKIWLSKCYNGNQLWSSCQKWNLGILLANDHQVSATKSSQTSAASSIEALDNTSKRNPIVEIRLS